MMPFFPSYSLTIEKVGLDTTSVTPSAFAKALMKVVFPAPISPSKMKKRSFWANSNTFCAASSRPAKFLTSIFNEYEGKNGIIYHFDFYRIKNLQEAYDIGYEEYFYSDHICLIEWPEKVEELLPEHYVKIEITAPGETERLLSISKI